MIQPFVRLVVSLYTWRKQMDIGLHESNMLNSYNQFNDRLDQQENVCIHHDEADCQTSYTDGFVHDVMLYVA